MAITVNQQGLSFIQYLTDGVTANFPFIFEYIKAADIVVYVNSTPVTYTFLNASTVTPTVLPLNGDIVTIRRFTESDARIVDFQDGAQLSEAVLDTDSNQMFFLAQETMDISNFGLGVDPLLFTMDARGYRIINVGDAEVATDAPNKGQLDTVEAAAIAAGAAAQATADAAVVDADAALLAANAAVVTANGIASTANTALVNSAAAVITADAAAVTANAISATANTALANAATAQAAADAAQSTADAAIPATEKAAANGVATLDAGGKIPEGQLPDMANDVLEYANAAALPVTGVAGIIYVTLDNNKTFRWSGTEYINIGGGLSEWVTATAYTIGTIVIADDKFYWCLVDHTSATFSTDLIAGDWKEISAPSSAGTATYMLANAVSDIGGYYQAVALNAYTAAAALVLPTAASTTPALMGSFASNIGYPNISVIPSGLFNVHYETQKSAGSINYYTYFELYKRDAGGTETLLGTSDPSTQTSVNTLVSNNITIPITSPIPFLTTDRGVIKIYVVTLSSTSTVSLRVDDSTSARIELPAATVDATNFVPYNGATTNLDMGIHNITTTGTIGASNLSGTNTGDLSTQGQSEGSPTVVSKLLAQFNQLTTVASGERLFEGGNGNELVNPSFAGLNTAGLGNGWTNSSTNSTATITTTSGEFATGVQAQKIALASGILNLSQSVPTNAGATKQYVIGATYRVPSTMADFQICTLIAGAEKTCVPSANLILDDSYHSIEIPEVITPGSTVGIKFKTTSSYTANAFFDAAYIKQGIGAQNLSLDFEYVAKISGTEVVSSENVNFITTCTTANPVVCTFVTGIFTVAPICKATMNGGGRIISVGTTTTTSVSIQEQTLAGSDVNDTDFTLTCTKTGNDYLAASAAVYSQSSANYSQRAYTPTYTGFGTVSSSSCYESREGEFNVVSCRFTVGTTTATEARVSLPTGLTSSSSISTSGAIIGLMGRQTSANNGIGVMIEPSVSYLTFTGGVQTASMLAKQNGNAIASSGDTFSFTVRVPISGWSNSSTIVGTFAGTPKVPGLDGNVDTFSVSYGTGSISNVCNASPCDFILQDGDAVYDAATSPYGVTRSSAGSFVLNTKRTYTYLTCHLAGWVPGIGGAVVGPIACTNCNSVAFNTRDNTWLSADTYGTLTCKGKY